MNIIAIESSTERCSVALESAGQQQQLISERPRQHAEQILPMIDALLAEAQLSRQQIDQVAFGQGPGSFTGVRVACSVAQGIGYGLDIPVLPISSLAALAQSAATCSDDYERVIAAQDARLGEIYVGSFEFERSTLLAIGKEKVLPPQTLGEHFDLTGNHWIAAGSAWQAYRQELQTVVETSVGQLLRACRADALAILTLASGPAYADCAVSADQAQPVYLRDQVTQRK